MSSNQATARATDPKSVMVRITAGNPPTVEPKTAKIHICKDEEILWECVDASGQPTDFKVIFKGESPFHERVFDRGRSNSGGPRADVTPDPTRSYPYLIIAGGTLDPDVIVEQ